MMYEAEFKTYNSNTEKKLTYANRKQACTKQKILETEN